MENFLAGIDLYRRLVNDEKICLKNTRQRQPFVLKIGLLLLQILVPMKDLGDDYLGATFKDADRLTCHFTHRRTTNCAIAQWLDSILSLFISSMPQYSGTVPSQNAGMKCASKLYHGILLGQYLKVLAA